jgi:hypothetical protein
MEAPESNVLFGIAKKWTLELEAMSLQAQGTVISFMNSAMQYRKLNLEQAAHDAQIRAQEKQLEFMKAQQERQQQNADIERAGIVLAR